MTASTPRPARPHPDDKESQLFERLRGELTVAAVCDVLDALDCRRQAMHARLRPLLSDPAACGFAGRARTLRWMDTDYVVEADPYGLEIEAMDSLLPGDVVVHSTDPAGRCAPWGDLMTTVAMQHGAVGCVCDGMIRDSVKILQLGFPVFCAGMRPLDSKGRARVMAFDVPIECGGVPVRHGDIIFADYDGIVVIPRDMAERVVQLALVKVGKESLTRRELEKGRTLREVYDQFGVL